MGTLQDISSNEIHGASRAGINLYRLTFIPRAANCEMPEIFRETFPTPLFVNVQRDALCNQNTG